MAIISGTAIAGAAITASTIASGAAFAASAAGTAVNLAQASKQKKAQQEAEEAASVALESARKKLEVNYLKGLSIQKEPYELAREAGLSGLSQIVQAGQEGEQRGAAATAGKANLFNQQQQAQSRTAMGQELQGLQRAAAAEDARLQGLKVDLDVAEVEGQQASAQQAALNRSAAMGNVFKGIGQMGSIAGQQIPEYLNINKATGTGVTQGPFTAQNLNDEKLNNALANTFRLNDPIFSQASVNIPSFNTTPLDQQYDSVTGRLIN